MVWLGILGIAKLLASGQIQPGPSPSVSHSEGIINPEAESSARAWR